MAIRPGEVERGELLDRLAPLRVRNAQLLRWVQAGLLPRPRREGLGRGRGGQSYYPRLAVLQAESLARLLKHDRSLVEAGWRLWLIGYPVTPFARALLLEELEAEEITLQGDLARVRRGKPSRLLAEVKRRGGDPARNRLKGLLRPQGLQVVARMVAAQRLGVLKVEEYTEDDWASYQDAALTLAFPGLADHPAFTSVGTLPAGIQTLTHDANIGKLRRVLRTTEDKLLVTARNEVQWLWEYSMNSASPESPFPDRGDFLWFLQVRLQPNGRRAIARVMQALGQEHVPPSPLQRLLRAQQPLPAPASPPASGT